MNCPACGTGLVLVGKQLYRQPYQPPPMDDKPAGVVASIQYHIAVARMSDDPALLAILDDLERALAMLANES